LVRDDTTFVVTTVHCMNPPMTGPYAGFAGPQRDARRRSAVKRVLEAYARARDVQLADLGALLCEHPEYLEADGVRLNETGRRATWSWLSEIAARTAPPR
jgi:hypothetical protein